MVTIEPLLFTGAGGFALGIVSGYALKKIIKIAAIIVGAFTLGMAYLAWKGIISVNNDQLTNLTTQTLQSINHTATEIMNQTAAHATSIDPAASSLPIVGIVGYIPGFLIGLKKG